MPFPPRAALSSAVIQRPTGRARASEVARPFLRGHRAGPPSFDLTLEPDVKDMAALAFIPQHGWGDASYKWVVHTC